MSIIKQVQYEINEDGNCDKCDQFLETGHYGWICRAFNCSEMDFGCIETLDDCKDFLAEEKAKVYCDGCLWLFSDCSGCIKLHKQDFDEYAKPYFKACKDRVEE